MSSRFRKIKGHEFIQKILDGERDLSGIEIEDATEVAWIDYKLYGDLVNYLKKQDFKENPIVISNSNFWHVKAPWLSLPYIVAENTDFSFAAFPGANFQHGNFYSANFNGAHFLAADFKYAELGGAQFNYAELENADFRYVKNLENALELDRAIYFNTIVTPKEENILMEALKNKRLFDIR